MEIPEEGEMKEEGEEETTEGEEGMTGGVTMIVEEGIEDTMNPGETIGLVGTVEATKYCWV